MSSEILRYVHTQDRLHRKSSSGDWFWHEENDLAAPTTTRWLPRGRGPEGLLKRESYFPHTEAWFEWQGLAVNRVIVGETLISITKGVDHHFTVPMLHLVYYSLSGLLREYSIYYRYYGPSWICWTVLVLQSLVVMVQGRFLSLLLWISSNSLRGLCRNLELSIRLEYKANCEPSCEWDKRDQFENKLETWIAWQVANHSANPNHRRIKADAYCYPYSHSIYLYQLTNRRLEEAIWTRHSWVKICVRAWDCSQSC
jgi:hypothetical protein